jgi:UDP-N-acetylglucosamine acyltransferase
VSADGRLDPRAVIDPRAELGREVTIGPYCVIGPGVVLGDRCHLGAHVVVEGPCEIGEETHVASMVALGGAPQDLKYGGEPTRLRIGRRNRIREFVTINRGTVGGGAETSLGDDNLLMAYVHIAHDCRVGDRTIFGNAATLAGHVEVGDEATIGAFSGIHQFCRVARHAFLGGYTVLTQDALPWVMTVGNRAQSHGLNLVGLKRRGVAPATIQALKRCYTLLVRSGLRQDEALAQAEAEFGHIAEVRYFIEFVRASERGVCR